MSLVATLHHVRRTVPAPWLASLLALGALTACASETKSAVSSSQPAKTHAEVSDDVTATAKVVAVDQATRMVTLTGETGDSFAVHCGDEVRNFAQISVGDTLKVHFKRTLGATLLPVGSDPALATGGVVAGRAPVGSMPAAGVGAIVSFRVKISSIDMPRDIVVFALPSGQLIAHTLQTSEGREFVQGLRVGDLVQLDYSEALALSIEKL
jgi:hypothetical protein